MDIRSSMRFASRERPPLGAPGIKTRHCMMCQYGIFDTPVDGKLNCFEAGPGNIKLLSRKEVEEMTSCDKMVHWAKMKLENTDVKDSELKRVENIIR